MQLIKNSSIHIVPPPNLRFGKRILNTFRWNKNMKKSITWKMVRTTKTFTKFNWKSLNKLKEKLL